MKAIYLDCKSGWLVENFDSPPEGAKVVFPKSAEEALDALTHPENRVPVVTGEFGLWEVYNALESPSAASRTRR